jgi:osmotically-inducible protein OsmY
MTRIKRNPLVIALAAASLAGALTACAPLILGGAAVSAMVAVDRRTSGTQIEDETIELKGATRLRELEAAGVLYRLPLRHNTRAYALTKRGLALRDTILALRKWGAEA